MSKVKHVVETYCSIKLNEGIQGSVVIKHKLKKKT